MITISNILVCTFEIYIIIMLGHIFWRWSQAELILISSKRSRMMLLGLLILQTLELAASMYDINGPGDHFPLPIRIPIMIIEAVIIISFVI